MKVYSCIRHKVFKMGQTKTRDGALQYFGTLKSWTKRRVLVTLGHSCS